MIKPNSTTQSRALLAGFGAALLYLAVGSGFSVLFAGSAAGELVQCLAAPLPVLGWAKAKKQLLGLCRPGRGALAPAIVFACVAALAALLLPSQVLEDAGSLTALRLCLAAPLAEELVFRGVVQSFLQPLGSGGAVMVQALLFAMQHGSAAAMVYALCMGLVLGWMRQRTGSVLPGIVLHIINNLLVFWAG